MELHTCTFVLPTRTINRPKGRDERARDKQTDREIRIENRKNVERREDKFKLKKE